MWVLLKAIVVAFVIKLMNPNHYLTWNALTDFVCMCRPTVTWLIGEQLHW